MLNKIWNKRGVESLCVRNAPSVSVRRVEARKFLEGLSRNNTENFIGSTWRTQTKQAIKIVNEMRELLFASKTVNRNPWNLLVGCYKYLCLWCFEQHPVYLQAAPTDSFKHVDTLWIWMQACSVMCTRCNFSVFIWVTIRFHVHHLTLQLYPFYPSKLCLYNINLQVKSYKTTQQSLQSGTRQLDEDGFHRFPTAQIKESSIIVLSLNFKVRNINFLIITRNFKIIVYRVFRFHRWNLKNYKKYGVG